MKINKPLPQTVTCPADRVQSEDSAQALSDQSCTNEQLVQTCPKIGRYENLEEVGHGGMGQVYKAFDPVMNRTVALKRIKTAATSEETQHAIESFMQEVRITANLDHPNIVKAYTVVTAIEGDPISKEIQKIPYLVMEYVPGCTLEDKLEELGSPPKRNQENVAYLLHLYGQILESVRYMHSEGVIHGDLKPSNIIIDKRGRAHILDFGIARLINSDSNPARLQSSAKSANQDGFVGSLPYSAPELVHGKKTNERTDIYALGALLYRMLLGETPVKGQASKELLAKLAAFQKPKDPHSKDPDIPDTLSRICMKAISKNPRDRYKTVTDLQSAVGNFIERRSQGIVCRLLKPITSFVQTHPQLATSVIFTLLIGNGMGLWHLRNQESGNSKGTPEISNQITSTEPDTTKTPEATPSTPANQPYATLADNLLANSSFPQKNLKTR